MPRRSRTCCPIFSSSKKTKSTNDRGHRLADARLSPAPAGTSEHVPPEAKHGLFILVDKPQDQVDGVDFVALHGLNGHYRRTWSGPVLGSDEPYNWLEKDLPRAIPNARVMSYGYDSAVFSQSVADIGDFADQLLEQLLVIRSSQGERDRPLLFLCHSLGGIVFKKALIRARERDRYEETLRKVRGVAFFGTPHQGSGIADWANSLANIVKTFSFGMNTHSALVQDLMKDSAVLFEVSKSFVHRGKGLKILSFIETRHLSGTNFMVVPRASATLLVPNEIVIPLNGDHRTICRSSNTPEDKSRLQLVLANLKDMAKEASSSRTTFTTVLSDEAQKSCLQQLYPGNYESFKDLNVTRAPGTCEWLLRHHQYKDWRDGDHSSFLWVSANAGCGKSTLAKFLIEHLRSAESSNGKPEAVCHFFFKEGTQKQQSVVLAIRAILHQIFTRDEALMRHLFFRYEKRGAEMMSEFDTLFEVFQAVVRDPEAPNVVCVFDGLDECPEDGLTLLLRNITGFFQSQYNSSKQEEALKRPWKPPYLKVLLLSRPENSIRKAIRKQDHSIRLRGENETKAIEHDVSLVIQQCVKELEDEGIPSTMLRDFSKSLQAGADNTFLWVTLMIQVFRDRHNSSGGTSRKELLVLLRGRDIFAVYKHMLGKISTQPDSLKMLRTILAAQTPLSIEQMSIALASLPSHRTLEDVSLEIKYPREDYIRVLCGHFVRFMHGKVHLVHQTAREFLLAQRQPESTGSSKWQGSMTMLDSHQSLLVSCVSYLRCGEQSLWDESLSLGDPEASNDNEADQPPPEIQALFRGSETYLQEIMKTRRLLRIHPFFGYAGLNWAFHLDQLPPEPDATLVIEPLEQVMALCYPVDGSPGYPTWTLARTDFDHFQGECWHEGVGLTPFERQARVVLGLRIDSAVEYFIRIHFATRTARGDAMIHIAAGMESVSGCRFLLKFGADVNTLDASGKTALDIAISRCYPAIAEFLVSNGASVTLPALEERRGLQCAVHGRGALHCAAKFGCPNLAALLMAKGTAADLPDPRGRTPLWYATESNKHEVVDLLLSKAADINSRDTGNKTIGHIAAKSGDIDTIKTILRHNPDVNAADDEGNTPLHYIRRRPTMDMRVVSGFVPGLEVDNARPENNNNLEDNSSVNIPSPEDSTNPMDSASPVESAPVKERPSITRGSSEWTVASSILLPKEFDVNPKPAADASELGRFTIANNQSAWR